MSQIVNAGGAGTTLIGGLTGATDHAVVVGTATGGLQSLAVAGDGEILIGSAGADPVLTTLTAGTGINIANAAGAITITNTGVMSNEFQDDVFRIIDDGDNTKKIAFQADQITTATVRTLTMCDQDLSLISPSFPGAVTAGTGLTITTGNATITAGNLTLPSTNAAFTEGVMTVGGALFMHSLGIRNLFFGANSGAAVNLGTDNTGFGYHALIDVDAGNYNTAFGALAGESIVGGTDNTALGYSSLSTLTAGSYNISIGSSAGSSLTGTDSSNIVIGNTGTLGDNNKIRIGTQGTGNGQQDNCFIAGIHGVTPGGATQYVIVDANGELGSTASAGGTEFADNVFRVIDNGDTSKKLAFECSGITTSTVRTITMDDRDIDMDAVPTSIVTDSGTCTPTNGSFSIVGGTNCSTSASGPVVTVNATGGGGGGAFTWTEVTTTSTTMAVNNAYVANNAGLVSLTLPSTAAFGSEIKVLGKGAGGWSIGHGVAVQIIWNESISTTLSLGTLESTDRYDFVHLVCTTANTRWTVQNSKGNINVT